LIAFVKSSILGAWNKARLRQESTSNRLRIEKQKQRMLGMLKKLAIATIVATLAIMSSVQAQEKASTATPNDAQIAQIVVTANTLDIEGGNLAAKVSKDKAVKEFAETMVRDHTAVNTKAAALAKKLGMTPEESATSKSMKSDGEAQLRKLKALEGKEFDKAYVDHEVAFHTTVIEALDKTLLPSTKNPELKNLLETSRPIFIDHLKHAKELQKSLSK
jgi:putative membrane protein